MKQLQNKGVKTYLPLLEELRAWSDRSKAVDIPLFSGYGFVRMDLSSGARGGLSIFIAGIARQVADKNVTINNLLPGAFETDRLRTVLSGAAKRKGITYEEARAERIASIPAKRLGEPAEFGAACAFLCSAQAGFITGQNLLIDGGGFPGAF